VDGTARSPVSRRRSDDPPRLQGVGGERDRVRGGVSFVPDLRARRGGSRTSTPNRSRLRAGAGPGARGSSTAPVRVDRRAGGGSRR
jgi:hypothetical protein